MRFQVVQRRRLVDFAKRTLTMISSIVTEPLNGFWGWVLVSMVTEQGLNTCRGSKK